MVAKRESEGPRMLVVIVDQGGKERLVVLEEIDLCFVLRQVSRRALLFSHFPVSHSPFPVSGDGVMRSDIDRSWAVVCSFERISGVMFQWVGSTTGWMIF